MESLAAFHRVPTARLGVTGGSRLRVEGQFVVDLTDAVVVYEGAIPKLMSQGPSAG